MKSEIAEMDTKKSIPFLLISTSLILLNIDAVSIDEIIHKIFDIKIPSELIAIIILWLVWGYLLLQLFHIYKLSDQKIFKKITKEFYRQLAKYSRKKKEKIDPELYTPQYLVTPKSKFKLCWECKYCQVRTVNLEPAVTIRVTALPVIILFLISNFKVLFEISILLSIVIPFIAGILAIFSQLFNLYEALTI